MAVSLSGVEIEMVGCTVVSKEEPKKIVDGDQPLAEEPKKMAEEPKKMAEEPKKKAEVIQKPQEPSTMYIVTAGLSRRGKSTALNNIFDCKFENKYSAKAVTKEIQKVRSEGDEQDTLVVIDTPGLASVGSSFSKFKRDIQAEVKDLEFVLLYCHSVSPSNTLGDDEKKVVKNLQKALGKEIWKKCVVLFTFSDILRSQECPSVNDRDKYIEHLRDHAKELTSLLKSQCGRHAPEIKIVFDVFEKEDVAEIVAVPVGREVKNDEEYQLVPGIEELNWKEVAFLEIMRREDSMNHRAFLNLHSAFEGNKHIVISSAIGVGVGTVVGGVGGTLVGALAGGVGAAPGAVLGAAAGGITGGMAGGNFMGFGATILKEISYRRKSLTMEQKIDTLKSSTLITSQEQQQGEAEEDTVLQQQLQQRVQPHERPLSKHQIQSDNETAQFY